MFKNVLLTTLVSTLVLLASSGTALGFADGRASCVGIGASVTASQGGSVPAVLAVVRGILGAQGVGAWVSSAAQEHEGTIETCFPDFPAP